MEPMKQCLLRKVKSVISVIYNIVLWVTSLSSAMQTPNSSPSHHHLQLGIGALISSTAQNLNRCACTIHSYMVSSPSPSSSSSSSSSSSLLLESSSSSSWSSTMGDLLGTESGVYVISNEETLLGGSEETKPCNYIQRKRNQQIETKREFPPPIPSLARTENLTGRMPWIFNRHYVDGRLVLSEQRVKYYEYFETQRENGRLMLNLVPLDDTIRCCHSVYEEDEDVEAIDEGVEAENDGDDEGNMKEIEEVGDQLEQKGSTILLASSMPEPWGKKRSKKGGDHMHRCSTYAGKTISSPSFFSMPMPVNKLIHNE